MIPACVCLGTLVRWLLQTHTITPLWCRLRRMLTNSLPLLLDHHTGEDTASPWRQPGNNSETRSTQTRLPS